MFCQQCGAENIDEAKYCFKCGSTFLRPSQDSTGPGTDNFRDACRVLRESVYGIKCNSPGAGYSAGTGFSIAEGVIATTAHVLHLDGDKNKSLHESFQVIRELDIKNNKMEPTRLIAEDTAKDIALLRTGSQRPSRSVILEHKIVETGTSCGTLGFPLCYVDSQGVLRLDMHFQSGSVSCYFQSLGYYEVDYPSYHGMSGGPGFTKDGIVVGMHKGLIIPRYQSNMNIFSAWLASPQIISFARENGVHV